MIDHGLTTFAEWEERPNDPPRSDCHAWSASPNIEIFRTVLGMDSAAPGFSRVSVRPNLGKLKAARVPSLIPTARFRWISVRVEPDGPLS